MSGTSISTLKIGCSFVKKIDLILPEGKKFILRTRHKWYSYASNVQLHFMKYGEWRVCL